MSERTYKRAMNLIYGVFLLGTTVSFVVMALS